MVKFKIKGKGRYSKITSAKIQVIKDKSLQLEMISGPMLKCHEFHT